MKPADRLIKHILFFLLVSTEFLNAQVQEPGQSAIGSSTVMDTLESDILPLDTSVTMTYVVIDNPDISYSDIDTFSWEDTKDQPLSFDWGHLGNYGSPARSLAPSMSQTIGFSTGWDQYDPYYIDADSFRYFNQDVPVARIRYSQAGQRDTYIDLDFGRSFAKGLSLSISYARMNQDINQETEFAHQHQKNTAFGVGVWHNSPSGKYDAFYQYLSNAAEGEENGGISEPDSIGSPRIPNPSIPVFLENGFTTHKHRSFLTKQIFHLIDDTSSPGIDLWLKANFKTGLYKYVDDETPISDYYGPEYSFDERGIRQFTYEEVNQFAGGVTLPWKSARSIISTSLNYRSISLEQEPEERKITELFWDATGDFQWLKELQLKGRMSFGLGQADGTFLFRADGILNTGLLGKFSGYWSVISRRPYLVESSLYVNQQLIYKTDFKDPFTNDVGIAWNWEKQKLNAGINWLLFDNFIYFDSLRHPAQLGGSFSLRRFFIQKDFDFRWIGAKGKLIWQPDSKKELAIPDLLYTAALYGRVKVFQRKLVITPGIDITYHQGYNGLSYFPVNGRYHLTNGPAIPDYFRIDAALGIRIKFLEFFMRVDDIVGIWDSRVLYQADYYPHYPGYFRIGIEAGFFN